MPNSGPLITLSVPTSGGGVTAAATLSFYTIGYKPPRQLRASTRDVVKNQNGQFIYVYDNGPGPHEWDQFEIEINDTFKNVLGTAETQLANLQFLWQYIGNMGMAAPEGVYQVGWAGAPMEISWKGRYPGAAGDKVTDYRVVVNIEER